jgi:hypothetical protein
MGCCGKTSTLIDYHLTYKDGTTEIVKHEDGGLARVRQIRAKATQTLTYKAVPRAK